ncbi:CLUMA_CG017265, isoform A [Clunio marinus]|uniref:CLUMA_CG017265, isoform A n=1 Tax=Clunio marinus TaxID=568069 RepID=A0A1J1IWT2_9DIPT|nr:CLUMA_CG017265, isoform A [Clunio marinus]
MFYEQTQTIHNDGSIQVRNTLKIASDLALEANLSREKRYESSMTFFLFEIKPKVSETSISQAQLASQIHSHRTLRLKYSRQKIKVRRALNDDEIFLFSYGSTLLNVIANAG